MAGAQNSMEGPLPLAPAAREWQSA